MKWPLWSTQLDIFVTLFQFVTFCFYFSFETKRFNSFSDYMYIFYAYRVCKQLILSL